MAPHEYNIHLMVPDTWHFHFDDSSCIATKVSSRDRVAGVTSREPRDGGSGFNANAEECGKRIDFSNAKDVTGGLKHRPVEFVGSL